ncbi:hypothetical protein FAM09_16870 [Niastella caeni]|uniref:Uncharacterized protein n=1 Tax=Niastella caeni TaxID=2569763 RepID=A0A4S8HS41_9BACT|nr:hypothetical protein [Niastella caeni]THU38348.1 hypothetical protein FAM09_16870 [Niastella caeni]
MTTKLKDKIKAYDLMLQKHIDKKDFVKINRTFKEREDPISGFILGLSKTFLLVQCENEFLLNGYSIIRKDQFDSLRCNKYDHTIKKILKQEGVIDKNYGINISIKLTTWQTIFRDLKKNDYHVIIECEDMDEPLFDIGIIKRIGTNSLAIQYYSPTGLLENKLTTIPYKDITIVKFGDRYTTTFRKYLRKSAKK